MKIAIIIAGLGYILFDMTGSLMTTWMVGIPLMILIVNGIESR